jgi:hypothetical protein
MVSRPGPASRETTAMADTISRGRNTAGFEYVGSARRQESTAFGVATCACDEFPHLLPNARFRTQYRPLSKPNAALS